MIINTITRMSDRLLGRVLREDTASAGRPRHRWTPCIFGVRYFYQCVSDGQGRDCWLVGKGKC